MERRKKWIVGGAVALAALGTAGGIAAATGAGDDETPITGSALERASAAALAHTHGGRVTETEAGDEEGAYEVEVIVPDGRQVDVHLDSDFKVINSVGDDDGLEGPDDDGPNDSEED